MKTLIGFIILCNIILLLEFVFLIITKKKDDESIWDLIFYGEIVSIINPLILILDIITAIYFVSHFIGALL